jgi:hypothetical protein
MRFGLAAGTRARVLDTWLRVGPLTTHLETFPRV